VFFVTSNGVIVKKAIFNVVYMVYVICPYCGCDNAQDFISEPNAGEVATCECCDKDFELE